MIIACTSCPAQYSVPDAKVQGKKVRVTCKHCGTGIIVDGTGLGPPPSAEPAPMSLPVPVPVAPRVLAPFDLPRAVGADDDATRVMLRPGGTDYSVHEEPTVIGQIPREALEAERRFALRTEPPQAGVSEAPRPSAPLVTPVVPPPQPALAHDAPERAVDVTAHSSPRAFRGGAASLPPQPGAEALLSGSVPEFRARKWPWVVGLALLLTLLVVVSQVLR